MSEHFQVARFTEELDVSIKKSNFPYCDFTIRLYVKTMENADVIKIGQVIHHSKGLAQSFPKMCIFLI